jgi:hypothetical protein
MSQPRDDRQDDLFRPPLEEIINLRHPLVRLAGEIDWDFLARRQLGVSGGTGAAAVADASGGRASNRSSFLIGELHLSKLSETVVVHGNAPHDRPSFLVGHLIGHRAGLSKK